jgi:hypothetical protein
MLVMVVIEVYRAGTNTLIRSDTTTMDQANYEEFKRNLDRLNVLLAGTFNFVCYVLSN